MTDPRWRPLLFLDVDGPLIPFGAPSGRYPLHEPVDALLDAGENPLLARIDPEHGGRLTALDCELVWATTWMEDANDTVAPRLGLPRLPLVTWPDEDPDEHDGLHWKTRPLVAGAAGRPFIWLDDEITDRDRTWVSAHHPSPALLHRVAPETGLTEADYTTVQEWLRDLDA